jgi:biopolymer transport protein ExbD
MGGAAPEPQGGKGKKSMDAPINLVPYIDLMTTIITFLMMTAVWTQIASLDVQNASGGAPEDQQEEEKDKPPPIMILIADRAVKVQEEGGELQEFPVVGEGYDFEGISNRLKALKAARPERVEVKVQAEDSVKYSNIVKVIDIATGHELSAITLTPVPST